MTNVSIITPTYNRASTIPRTIRSVQKQTHSNYEHIIVDDGSTDGTEDVVASLNQENIRYIGFDSNNGANAARNRGIEAADGQYIAFLDSDDCFHKEKLRLCSEKLDELSEKTAGVFHSAYFIMDGRIIDVSRAEEGSTEFKKLQYGNPIGGFSDVMFRSDVFEEVGLLDPDMPAYQDYEFFLRVLSEFDMWGIKKPLSLKYKQREDNSATRISDQLETKVQAQRLLLQKHPNLISERVKSEFYYTRGFLEARNGDVQAARKQFKRALLLDRKDPLYYYHYIATFGGKSGFARAEQLKKKVKLCIR